MTKTTAPGTHNWTGVRSFDHAQLARLPEYQAAAHALNDLVTAMRHKDIPGTQDAWLVLVRDLATVADVDRAREVLRDWAATNADDPAADVAVAVRTGMLDQHRAALLEHFERFKPAP